MFPVSLCQISAQGRFHHSRHAGGIDIGDNRNDAFAAYGTDAVQFLVMVPSDGADFSRGNGTHIGSTANVYIVTISERLAKRENDHSLAITPGLWFRKGKG